MQGLRLLLTNRVDHKTAALLFYALQTASTNLSRTTLEPRPQQVVIDPRGIVRHLPRRRRLVQRRIHRRRRCRNERETNRTFPQNQRRQCARWVPHPSAFSAEGGRQADRTISLLCFAPPYNVPFLIRSEGLGRSCSSPTPDAQEICSCPLLPNPPPRPK
jgi:hypothetical protein